MGGMLVEYRMRWESLLAALSAKQKPQRDTRDSLASNMKTHEHDDTAGHASIE